MSSRNREGNNNNNDNDNDNNKWDLTGLPEPKNPNSSPNDNNFTFGESNNNDYKQGVFGSEDKQRARAVTYYKATKCGKRKLSVVSVFSRIKWQFNKFRDELRIQFEDLRDQFIDEKENYGKSAKYYGFHKRLHIAKKVALYGLGVLAYCFAIFNLYLEKIRSDSESELRVRVNIAKQEQEQEQTDSPTNSPNPNIENGPSSENLLTLRERLAVLKPNSEENGVVIPIQNETVPTIQILNKIFDENGNVKGNIPAGTTLIRREDTGNYSEFVLKNDKENLRIISLFVVNNERKNS